MRSNLLFLLLATASTALAQGPSDAADRIGAGDELSIEVYGEDELTRQVSISHDCTLSLPLIGRVEACERTTDELAAHLTDALGTYLREPRVTVTTLTYGGRTIEVKGAVREPGIVPLARRTSLSEAITLAGGPADEAVVQVDLVRDGEKQAFYLPDLDAQQSPVWVLHGDTVVLHAPAQVFVDGEVEEPGSVAFRDGLSVSQAVALAGGPTDFAGTRAVVLRDGEKIPVNLRRIRRGAISDPILRPDDTLILRRSWL